MSADTTKPALPVEPLTSDEVLTVIGLYQRLSPVNRKAVRLFAEALHINAGNKSYADASPSRSI